MFPENLKIDSKITLNNDVEMPVFGLGTYNSTGGRRIVEVFKYALDIGYRHIDTASFYGNEKEVGNAVRKSGIPREDVFITTKLWNTDHGYEKALSAFERSLRLLGLSYIDLYLIHWPVEGLRNESWKALERLLEEGKCRAIGVSNYMLWHLKELFTYADIIPAVNQVEFSPYLYQKDLLEFCCSHGIRLEAYSPLTKGRMLGDTKLMEIGDGYGMSPAQTLIRWALQKDVIVIPKSSRKERILENSKVFDFTISEKDMQSLDSFNRDLRTSWDPTSIP